ncbi:DUF1254 domain-containing protein [Rhizobium laguerreae]|uniref:DUF1254 domain-containing protein n=1 Tax=Rhizobium laguerreae TaxID=1076926 RepID=UPI001C8FAC2B|nr:DUF1254 domain-containing protein [Rhizobium laguerreae]MBY3389186.1 DUF1254 domain-containing protein [Rhizobium laguerreae]MBY3402937.1 DUF1254 domain-containing protein [Rhizobium laguerreae]MBY3409876.1 DUF1254 domain-containing protein [Rhizobium laguerreae]
MLAKRLLSAYLVSTVIVGTACAEDTATLNGPIDTRMGRIELQGGYPDAQSVGKIYDEIDFQRASQAYIWATPIVSMEALRLGNKRDWGVDYNDVGLVDGYTTPAVGALTGNNTTIYAGIFTDLGRDGPVVIDSPIGVYGVIDDFWQRPVVEVGPFGPDKGKGGKFLLLPPAYTGPVPAGYLPARSKTNQTFFIGRSFVKDGDIKTAVDTLARLKVYPLSKADNPPETRILKAGSKPMDSIPPSGFDYWKLLSGALDKEPVEERDRFFHAMLKPLGLEKGKPFAPDDRQRKLLADAAQVGFLMAQITSMAPRLANAPSYPGTHWEWVLTLKPDQEAAGYTELDERTDYTFEAITVADGMIKKIPGAGSQYMSAAKDKEGEWLEGGKAYTLHVPADVPAKEFWAVTVYDAMTRSMIKTDAMKAGVSSHDKLVPNPDGSIDVHFGPESPEKDTNWVKTLPGRGWFAYFRWYGPTEKFFDKSWSLPDIESQL